MVSAGSDAVAAADAARFRGRALRVLHGTYEIAGQGMMLARALALAGCDAHSFAYRVDWDGRVPDLVVPLDERPNGLARFAAMGAAFAAHAARFDVLHFHFGTSFFYGTKSFLRAVQALELRALRAMGKTIAFHFHGCEVRRRDHMRRTHPLATCTECEPFCDPAHQDELRARAAAFADLVFFSTLDLAESVPNGRHLPLAIEAARWEEAALAHEAARADGPPRDGVHGPVVIAHAPTNRLIKGTRHVEAAVAALSREFPKLELRMIDRRPWATMPAFLAECDVLVDQVFMGWYGLLAIEGMAERKAVVAYLRDDFRDRLSGCPVVSAEPATLADALRPLVAEPARRAALGADGAAYVRRTHDLAVVGRTLLAHYREALERRGGGA